jgi:RNA polymerase sigma factor (sigma-70 family)
VVRQIESLFDGGSVSGPTDRDLLDRFVAGRDPAGQAAVTALVCRHGPMVLGLYRQVLVDEHYAEDAFLAVFLVLAHKAPAIRDPDLLGNWLYGVALRTARNARLRLARRRKNERGDAMRRADFFSGLAAQAEPPNPPALSREEVEGLHEEIGRLPGSFRLPIVLYYFAGLTLEEASRRLHWPVGTVGSRLARARNNLRRGLARRGVGSSVVLAGMPSTQSLSPAVSSQLCEAKTRGAIDVAIGAVASATDSSFARRLAHNLQRSMLIHKLRLVSTSVLFMIAIATGAGLLIAPLGARDRVPEPSSVPQAALATIQPEAGPVPGQMTVVGRVLDPEGKPMVRATVEIFGRPRRVFTRGSWNGSDVVIGRGQTDADGRFRVDTLRTSSERY